ncbi:MAG: Jag N-terminal domain-containing protein [Pseudomonadota bacterium]|nr:Jag N-terminal domain-containing protein [Pseudomonadota bacterium]MEA3241075.1 Jag N-terminal domain-containing protein [Pseudomonadota bacterium]
MTRDFEGKNVQDAVKKACLQLNLSADRLHYEIVREETRKIFGLLGGKTAIIRVTVEEKEKTDLVKELIDSAFSDHIKEDVLAAAPADSEPELAKVVTKEDEIPPSQPPSPTPPAQSEKKEIKDTAVPAIDLVMVKKTLVEILALMDVSVKSVEGRLAPPDCHLVIEEQDGQTMLVSRKGEVLNALQYLINKLYGVRGGRVYVDCGGFRSRHEHNIKKLALKLAAKAKKIRKPVTINALNAHDRRIVHLLIQEDKSLYSRSKGDGEYKKIIIYPKNLHRNRDRNKAKAVKS